MYSCSGVFGFLVRRYLVGLVEQVELFARVRSLVRCAVRGDLPASHKHGTNQHSEDEVDNSNCSPHNYSSSGLLSRLKRDHPDLAQQVIDGELSATKAAREAGIVITLRRHN